MNFNLKCIVEVISVARLFFTLILLGRKTLEDVPCGLLPAVQELLEEEEQSNKE